MKYRVSIHFGDRDEDTAKTIAQNCANLVRMECYLVKDTTERKGTSYTPTRSRGAWARNVA